MDYLLEREQLLDAPLDVVFAFFSDAGNLAAITPKWLGFEIHTPLPVAMRVGLRLDYTIRLAGIPLRWRTRIARWDPPRRFVDVQERGPYALWEHSHFFEVRPAGVWMTDRVRYRLPFGALGRALHALAVRRALEAIFDYRSAQIAPALHDAVTASKAR